MLSQEKKQLILLILSQVVNILTTRDIAISLGPSDYSQFVLVAVFSAVYTTFTLSGEETAALRRAQNDNNLSESFFTTLIFRLIVFVALSFGLYGFFILNLLTIESLVNIHVLNLIVLGALGRTVINQVSLYYKVVGNFWMSMAVSVTPLVLIKLFLSAFLGIIDMDYALTIFCLGPFLLSILLLAYFVRVNGLLFSFQWRIVREGRYFRWTSYSNYLYRSADQLLIGIATNSNFLASYGLARMIRDALIQFVDIIYERQAKLKFTIDGNSTSLFSVKKTRVMFTYMSLAFVVLIALFMLDGSRIYEKLGFGSFKDLASLTSLALVSGFLYMLCRPYLLRKFYHCDPRLIFRIEAITRVFIVVLLAGFIALGKSEYIILNTGFISVITALWYYVR